jgi:hypothetical protein
MSVLAVLVSKTTYVVKVLKNESQLYCCEFTIVFGQ